MHTCNGCGRHLPPHRGKRRSCSIQCTHAARWWLDKKRRQVAALARERAGTDAVLIGARG